MRSKMIVLLPAYKQLILSSIERCVTDEQLEVCQVMVNQFSNTYSGFIGVLDLAMHSLDIQQPLDSKKESLTFQSL